MNRQSKQTDGCASAWAALWNSKTQNQKRFNFDASVRAFLIAVTLAAAAFATLSCLDTGRAQSSQGDPPSPQMVDKSDPLGGDPNSNIENRLGDTTFLAFSGNTIAMVNAETGAFEWKTDFPEKPCPYQIHPVEGDNNLALVTWIDEYTSPCIALIDRKLSVKLYERDAVICAKYGRRVLIQTISHLGAEGVNRFETAIWNTSTCKVEKQLANVSPLTSCMRVPASENENARSEIGGNGGASMSERIPGSKIVMSGPDSDGDVDVYGNTVRERVVKYDLKTGKQLFESKLEKEYGAAFELVADAPNITILDYATSAGNDILVAIDKRGGEMWRYDTVGQIYRVPVHPYTPAFSELAIAFEERRGLLAIFVVYDNSPPELQVINAKNGSATLRRSFKYGEGFVTSLEIMKEGILANVNLGKSAILLTLDGDVKDAPPSEIPPVYSPAVREPSVWFDRETGMEVEVALSAITVRTPKNPERKFEFFDPTARTADIAAVYGKPPRYLLLKYEDPGLSQDIASTERVALFDLDNGKWIVGDELSETSFKYYGAFDIVVTSGAIYRLSNLGEISASASFQAR